MEYTIRFMPQDKTAKVRPGTTILQAARNARVHVATRCGGNASCLMCKVETDTEHNPSLSSPTAAEQRKLGPLLERGIRLACQAKITGSAEIRLPEDPLKAAIRKQLERQQEDDLW